MSAGKNKEFTGTPERLHMTEEQAKAYNEFIDYMAKLYDEYCYLFDDGVESD